MNKMEKLEAEIKRLQEELKQANAEESDTPKIGETYWATDEYGNAFHQTWDDDNYDIQHLELGNAFKTEEEAEKHLAFLKLRARARRLVGDWAPDWDNNEEPKYYINCLRDYWDVTYVRNVCILGAWCFPTREKAQEFLDSLTDEEKKLLKEYW